MLIFLWMVQSVVIAYANEPVEINRLKEHAYIERMKEEENRLLSLDLERIRLEVEKKKLLAEVGQNYHQQGSQENQKEQHKPVSIKVVRIIDIPQRKEVELNINGERVTFIEKEKKEDIFVKEIDSTKVKIEYQKKEMTLGISL